MRESGVRVSVWLGVGGCAPCRDAHKYFLDGTDSYSLRRQHLIKCREADKPVDDIRKEIFERIRKQVVHSDIFSRFMRATYVVSLPYVSHGCSIRVYHACAPFLCDNHAGVPSVTTTPARQRCLVTALLHHRCVASLEHGVWTATHGG